MLTSSPRRVLPTLAASAVLATSLATFSAVSADEAKPVAWGARCSQDGVCLVYLKLLTDSDVDGIADVDERALSTDVADAGSVPRWADITSAVGAGMLPSFGRGQSEVVVVPETFPDGTPLITSRVTDTRTSALDRMGVSGASLKDFGLTMPTGVTIAGIPGVVEVGKDGKPIRTSKNTPPKLVGGVGLGTISQETSGDGAPVRPNDDPKGTPGLMGGDSQGGKTLWENVKQGVIDMFTPKKPDTGGADGGTKPVTLTDGDEGNAVLPLTAADFEKVITKLGGNRTPVQDSPLPKPDASGLDLNPRRTIILTDGDDGREHPMLKIFATAPELSNPSDRNTNYGPNGAVGPLQAGSMWPKEF